MTSYEDDVRTVTYCTWVETAYSLVKKHDFDVIITSALLGRADCVGKMREVAQAHYDEGIKKLANEVTEFLVRCHRRQIKSLH